MKHLIQTGDTECLTDYIPRNKLEKWKVIENLGFGPIHWDPAKVILDRRHYQKYFLDALPADRVHYIKGTDLRACYGGAEERFFGGASVRFLAEDHPELLAVESEPWFARDPEEDHDPFLICMGTKFESARQTEHWLFLHRAPATNKRPSRVVTDFKSVEGYWPVCCPVLRFAE